MSVTIDVLSSGRVATRLLRISHVVESVSRASGGVGPVVKALGNNLARRGHQVNVFCLRDDYTDKDSTGWDVPVTACDRGAWHSFGYSRAMNEICSACQADILHSHGLWTYPGIVARAASRRQGIPLMISPHGMLDEWSLRVSAWRKRFASLLYERKNLASAACLHALCDSEYQSIRAYGLKNPVAVIPNGVDLSDDEVALPAPWSIGALEGKNVLLFLGRIDHKKNVHGLIKAWRQLTTEKRLEAWGLVISGWSDGRAIEYETEVKQAVAEAELSESVHFTGPLYGAQKQAAFQNAQGFVLPSYSEGLPMAVLEAWSYRLPILMTVGCNIPEGFEAGAALKIGVEAESIAEGLDRFFSLSAGEREAIGSCGRRLVETQFAWPRIADRMGEVYRWMSDGGERPVDVRVV